MFIVALFTIAKIWEQCNYPPDKENVVYTYKRIFFRLKKGNPALCDIEDIT